MKVRPELILFKRGLLRTQRNTFVLHNSKEYIGQHTCHKIVKTNSVKWSYG